MGESELPYPDPWTLELTFGIVSLVSVLGRMNCEGSFAADRLGIPGGMLEGGGTMSWGGEVCLGGNQAASSKSPGVGPRCSQSEGVPGPKADAPVDGALVLTKGAGRNT